MTNPTELWQETLNELRPTLTRATFNTHLASAEALAIEADELRVALPNPHSREWVERRLNGRIERLASTVAGRPIRIQYQTRQPCPCPPEADEPSEPCPECPVPSSFQGFQAVDSNFTTVPNQFFTQVVPTSPPTVTALVATIIYKTIGTIVDWRTMRRQEWYEASHRDIAAAAGISPGSVPSAVATAHERGFIVVEWQATPRRYRLRYEDDPHPGESPHGDPHLC